MTTQLEISPETQAILNMEALWLKIHSLPHAQIATLVGISENTLREYFELYQRAGIEGLKVN